MTLIPGRYQIRVVSATVNARVCTVFYELLVPDFLKYLVMLSGMLLTAASPRDRDDGPARPGGAAGAAGTGHQPADLFTERYPDSFRRNLRQYL